MKVFVLTYNPLDKPERRIWGIYATYEKAEESRQKVIKQFGSFCPDAEIDEREVE